MGTLTATGNASGFNSALCGEKAAQMALGRLDGKKVDLAIVFASTQYKYDEVLKGIHKVLGDVPLVGCSTAGEFSDSLISDKAVVVMLLQSDTLKIATGIGKNLKQHSLDAVRDVFANFQPFNRSDPEYPHRSIVLLSDGLAGNGEGLVINVALKAGKETTIAGGAAGDGGAFKETFVFHGNQVHRDAVSAIEILSKSPCGIGVAHGWCASKIAGQVTKSEGNLLQEIDGKPAFELYKQYASAVKFPLDETNADMFMMTHELGISLFEKELKVRAPIKHNPDGSILMATEVPKAIRVNIVEAENEALLAAAKQATTDAVASLKGGSPAGVIVFDCVARKICLKADFDKEVAAIRQVVGNNVPVIGFNTYGEIARVPGQVTGFHNTTDVVFIIPK